jgi:hypothetical protein
MNGTAMWYGPDLTCLPIGTIQDFLSGVGGGRAGVEATTFLPAYRDQSGLPSRRGGGRRRILRKGIKGKTKKPKFSKEEHSSLPSLNLSRPLSLLSHSFSFLCVAGREFAYIYLAGWREPDPISRREYNKRGLLCLFLFCGLYRSNDPFRKVTLSRTKTQQIIFHFFKRKINESNCEKSYFCITT